MRELLFKNQRSTSSERMLRRLLGGVPYNLYGPYWRPSGLDLTQKFLACGAKKMGPPPFFPGGSNIFFSEWANMGPSPWETFEGFLGSLRGSLEDKQNDKLECNQRDKQENDQKTE